MVESILCDLAKSDPRWNVSILRYFNPVGAHESGLIGEDPNDVPSNLLPYISQVAIGKLPELVVFGKDYPTPDGTGVRDYIHVMDLAEGHLCALKALKTRAGVNIWNLGTGKGYSVMDVVRTFERVSGKVVPYRISSRRPGDVATCFADPTKAEYELNWRARRSLEDMLYDTWHWQTQNPDGYKKIN
jgi:UDP-glucose 4-epimerase